MLAPVPLDALARRFVDAFNRRDADELVSLCDAEVVWRPSPLAAGHRVYSGHDGMRQWVKDLDASPVNHHARVLRVEVLDESRFLVLSEVFLHGTAVSPGAMLGRVTPAGGLIEAKAYLSDERTLQQVGIGADVSRDR